MTKRPEDEYKDDWLTGALDWGFSAWVFGVLRLIFVEVFKNFTRNFLILQNLKFSNPKKQKTASTSKPMMKVSPRPAGNGIGWIRVWKKYF